MEILKIQKFRRFVGYSEFYCFTAVLSYAYINSINEAGYSRGDQYFAAYLAGTELLGDSDKLYKAALGNCVSKQKSEVPSSSASCPSASSARESAICIYHAQYVAHILSFGQLDGSG